MYTQRKNGFCIWSQSGRLVTFIVFLCAALTAQAASNARDIRVIIDMSGSMKQNDPHNHRVKAVQLFSEVLPDGIRSGIWTFAADVNMLVKHGMADKQWKATAFKKAKLIHSHGLFTNIEKALNTTARSYPQKPGNTEKHIILLTDGYVDVSKNKQKNIASRQRIIDKTIPLLVQSNIKLHTIALSGQADHDLLKLLSLKTEGNYKVIHQASDLDRYFFKLFQKTAKPDTIPFKRNRFKTDERINDFTIVLFNQNNPTVVKTPAKQKWTFNAHPDKVKWVKSDNYEIITVSKPTPGEWLVDAPVDPDNKVMVVTNLKLHSDSVPEFVLPGEKIKIAMHLTEDGKIIKRSEFIRLLKLSTIVRQPDEIARRTFIASYAGEGGYTSTVQTDELSGKQKLVLLAQGPTFTREIQHDFRVLTDPLVLLKVQMNKQGSLALVTSVDDSLLDKQTVSLLLKDPSGQVIKQTGYVDQIDIPSDYAGKTISIFVEAVLKGNKQYTNTQSIELPELKVANPETPGKVKKAAQPGQAGKVKQEMPVKSETVAEQATTDKIEGKAEDEEQETGKNWWLVFSLVLFANGLLAALGYLVYKRYVGSGKEEYSLDDDDEAVNDKTSENTEESIDEIEGLSELEDVEDISDGETEKTQEQEKAS